MYGGGGVVQRRAGWYVQLLGQIQNGVLSPWSVMVFGLQTWPKHTLVERKMKRKYATEYSTTDKWVSKSKTWRWHERLVREDLSRPRKLQIHNSQIPRLLRQKIMAYCGINLQTLKALRDTNQFFLVWLSWSAANWWAFNLVDFLLFHAWPRKLWNVRCFSCKSRTMGVTFSRNQTWLLCNSGYWL